MEYTKAITIIEHNQICPFCSISPGEILEETTTMIVRPSRAPYHKHHVMVIPKRHAITLDDLSKEEHDQLFALLLKWNGLLHTRHKDVILYLKDGHLGGPSEKTVEHFHFHLVPDCCFGAKTASLDREFLEQNDFEASTTAIRRKFLQH